MENNKIIPITENEVEKMYFTDAPCGLIAECFEDAYTKMEFVARIIEEGYKMQEYAPSIRINFDEK